MRRISRWLSLSLEVIAMALVVALSAVALLGVVDRYALHTGIGWTEEGARFLLIWASFLSAAVVFERRSHFAVMVMVSLLPRRVQGLLAILVNLVALAILGILFVQGLAVTEAMSIQRSPALNLPMNYIYASLPISLVFVIFFLLVDTLQLVGDALAGRYRVAVVGSSEGAEP